MGGIVSWTKRRLMNTPRLALQSGLIHHGTCRTSQKSRQYPRKSTATRREANAWLGLGPYCIVGGCEYCVLRWRCSVSMLFWRMAELPDGVEG